MVNSGDFIKRLETLLEYYGLTAAGFADKVKVQRSSISHLLSGRNKPSLDFVMKVVRTFPEVNLYWLLNGKGDFPESPKPSAMPVQENPAQTEDKEAKTEQASNKSIDRIIIFYSDGSFDSYTPQ